MKKAIYILYVIVFALAGWFAYICYRDLRFDADSSAGIIVSILGVMVASLIGWQIYNVLNIKGQIDKLETYNNDIKALYEKLDEYTSAQNLDTLCYTLTKDGRSVEAIKYMLLAIRKYSNVEGYKDANECIETCFSNLASTLCKLRLHKGEEIYLTILNEIIDSLKRDLPHFSNPKYNEAILCFFEYLKKRRDNIYEDSSEEERNALIEFRKKYGIN